jgi:hypothetical protein
LDTKKQKVHTSGHLTCKKLELNYGLYSPLRLRGARDQSLSFLEKISIQGARVTKFILTPAMSETNCRVKNLCFVK